MTEPPTNPPSDPPPTDRPTPPAGLSPLPLSGPVNGGVSAGQSPRPQTGPAETGIASADGPLLFVTGKLAEPALRRVLDDLGPKLGRPCEVAVLNIAVAALMTPAWVGRKLAVPPGTSRVILPGHCGGDLAPVEAVARGAVVERGPVDVRDLPAHFRRPAATDPEWGRHDIAIFAEINHAPRLARADLLAAAADLAAQGADLIDVGCDPAGGWSDVGDAVRALRDRGHRVSVDSFDPAEVRAALRAGAEWVLSVNGTNVDLAAEWAAAGAGVVAIPDTPADVDSLLRTVERLRREGVRHQIDPIAEPVGFGFAASLERCCVVRRMLPDAEMMLGVGNLTEMTGADSAGINLLLAGFCQEVGIRAVLTTAVGNWARSSVRELDLARRVVRHAVRTGVPPKHLDRRLHLLRDPKPTAFGEAALRTMQAATRDRNFRIFAEAGRLWLFNSEVFLSGGDAFDLMQQLRGVRELEPDHAFYLGWELQKAHTALVLGKTYRQDEALDWGFLTVPEVSHRPDPRKEKADG